MACARRLAKAGLRSTLFDKGRGIGGRVATRRVNALQFDHGAQYVTAKDEGFVAALRELTAMEAIAPWQDGTGRTKTVGIPGMSSLAKVLAAGLDIRLSAQVTAITPADSGWSLRIGNIEHRASHVIITVPAPQVAAFLGTDHPLVVPLSGVRLAPCLTLMAAVAATARFISRSDLDDPLAWIAQDSSKPGRPQSDTIAWVAQAGPAFSLAHLEKDPDSIAALMLPLLCDRLGLTKDQITYAAAHRWRYARVIHPLGQVFLRSPDGTLYLGGDWCLGPRVEAAWISGTAIADDLLGRAR